MTTNEKRIKIAEAVGREAVLFCHSHSIVAYDRAIPHEHLGVHVLKCPWCNADLQQTAPDYFNDLNAMHEAEKVLDAVQLNHYENELAEVCNLKVAQSMASAFRWHATAAQRAEAFGKTLSLW